MTKTLLLKPHLSEKSYALSQAKNVYVFTVPNNANRLSVRSAVSSQFSVEVLAVNIANIKGKTKRTVKKGGRPVEGKRSDTKKAYVTLKEGEKLPIFDAVEEETEKEEKLQDTISKAQEKKIAKDTKQKRSIRNTLGRAPRQVQNRGGDK